MRRRSTGFALSAIFFALCSATQAQQPKVPRIGHLAGAGLVLDQHLCKDCAISVCQAQEHCFLFRSTEDKSERYSDLAAELVRLDVDIIVVGGKWVSALPRKRPVVSRPQERSMKPDTRQQQESQRPLDSFETLWRRNHRNAGMSVAR